MNNLYKCNFCNMIKEESEYYFHKRYSKSKGEYMYRIPKCKKCVSIYKKEWVKNNPEAYKKGYELQNSKPHRRKLHREIGARRREIGIYREWQRNNKDKIKQYTLNRKEKEHEISHQEWESCKKYFDYSCAYCGISEDEHKKLLNQQLHREHVDDGGANDLSNCVPSCKSCNSSKGTNELSEWYNDNNFNFTNEKLMKINTWLEDDYKLYVDHKS